MGVKRSFDDNGDVVEETKKIHIENEGEADLIKKPVMKKFDDNKDISIIDEATGLSKCFHRIKTKLYCSLAPCYLETPIQGLRQQHLDPLIMTYNSKLEGIIISYNNVKLSKNNKYEADEEGNGINNFKYISKVSEENPFSFLWVYVDFVIWRPKINDLLEGNVILQSASHIGLLINDVFNATIKKFNIPETWEFIPNQEDESSNINDDSNVNKITEEGKIDNESSNNSNNSNSNNSDNNKFKKLGYWIDENGISIDGKIKFKVKNINVIGKSLSIEGTLLLSPEMDKDNQPVTLDENSVKQNAKKHISFGDEEEDSNKLLDSSIDAIPETGNAKENEDEGEDEDETAPKYDDEDKNSDSDADSSSDSSSSEGDAESSD